MAEKLNLPEEYVRDIVEHYYSWYAVRMKAFKYVAFVFTGLGRFIVRPSKFWMRLKRLEQVYERVAHRLDSRGRAIEIGVDERIVNMRALDPKVKEYYEAEKQRRVRARHNKNLEE